MRKYYTLMLNVEGDATKHSETIERGLSPVVSDWLRFTAYQYVLVSDRSATDIVNAIYPLLPKGASAVAVGLDINDRYGFASDLVADWFKKYP